MKKVYTILLLLLFNVAGFSQNYNMTAGTINACSGNFRDDGGNGNYSNSENIIETFCSSSGNCIRITFNSFSLENNFDFLRIYDGPSTASTLIGTYTGTTSPGTITSSTGCLTFHFTSDASVVSNGWAAGISCVTCTAATCSDGIQNQGESGIDCGGPCPACSCTGLMGSGVTTVASLPYSSGAGTTCGSGNDLTSANSTVCGSTSYYGGEDNVWVFTPTASGQVNINLTSSGSWTGLMLYEGCPLTSMGGATCIANSQSSTGNKALTVCVTAGVTYYLVLDSYPSPTCNAYSNLTISAPVPPGSCGASLGSGVVNVASLPYTSNGRTTCGAVNDLTSGNTITCGSTNYLTGEDEVFVFTPAASGNITISITSSGTYTGMMLYDGCPLSTVCSGTPGNCLTYQQSSSGSKSVCTNVTAGITYYLIIDSWASPSCNPYSITITAPSGGAAGATCGSPVNISSLPYSASGETTACFGNDYTSASTGSCGTSYESGEDKVYAYTATGSECLSITLNNASTSSIGFQVYSGCPGSAGTTCIGNAGGSNPLTGTVTLPGAGTYYIIVDTWSSPVNASYDISIASMGSGPVNDLPCNATPLSLNVYLSGDNSCSGSGSEPASPGCWSAGNMNTIWYAVTAPASGQLKIRTVLGTLTNTQIALYSGSCSSLSFVTGACNNNAPACGSSTYNNSEITATGLTSGATYYIRVDGANGLIGTFDIIAVDATVGFPPAAGQDCFIANPVCNQTISVGNPGYQAYGNTCDFSGSGICLASGERGSAWYQININSNGTLEFDIVPNDWPGAPSTSGTDYDFAIWKVAGSGSTDCSGILSGDVPVRCNYSGLGVTGCAGAGNAPAAYPGFDGAYESGINVSNGDIYLLVVSNFSNSTSGVTINFSNGSPINYAPSSSSVTWSGGTSTAWGVPGNWGGCNTPSCGIDAVISPSSSTQPVISVNSNVRNLTINPGATLTINPGITLTVCGDFTNNGNLIASPTSTIVFNNGSSVQNINGSLVGSDQFGNLVITKTGGSVSLNQDIDIAGSFTTTNATSIFNTNGNYIRVAGDFNNSSGATTFTNVTGGTLEFNGTVAQNYTAGSGTLFLNNVIMNHTGSGVTLAGNNMNVGSSGTLTLNQGKIITNLLEVNVINPSSSSVTTGNTTSFIQGYLRRKLNSTGSYDFPVGEAVKGYQRANINFTSATTIDNLLASFSQYGSVPAALNVSECSTTYNIPALNNGKWTINAYDSGNNLVSGNGTYTVTLYNLAGSYNNHTPASGWTVMKDPGSGWGLYGFCVGSPINAVVRTGMTGFSNFGTAQASTPLPVELIVFKGTGFEGRNLLQWTTATEINNDYFTLEQSADGISFTDIAVIDGNGNSSTVRNYLAYDENPLPGVTYYRLKQTDFDGNYSYSAIIAIRSGEPVSGAGNFRPNPTNGDVSFDFVCLQGGTVLVEVMDAYGKSVYRRSVRVEKGSSTISADLSELSPGIYSVRVFFGNDNYSGVFKVVKH